MITVKSEPFQAGRVDPEREYTQAAPDAQIRCASAGCTDPSAARAPVLSHVAGFDPELEIPLCASCYSRWNDKHGDEIDRRAVAWLTIYRHGQWWTEDDWQHAWDAARTGPIY